jgi:hypothetical protein
VAGSVGVATRGRQGEVLGAEWRGAPAWLVRVRTLIGAVGCGHFLLGYWAANFCGLFVH